MTVISIEPIWKIKKVIDLKERKFEALWLNEGPLVPWLKVIHLKEEANTVEFSTPASLVTLYKAVTKLLGNLIESKRFDLVETTPEIMSKLTKAYCKIKPEHVLERVFRDVWEFLENIRESLQTINMVGENFKTIFSLVRDGQQLLVNYQRGGMFPGEFLDQVDRLELHIMRMLGDHEQNMTFLKGQEGNIRLDGSLLQISNDIPGLEDAAREFDMEGKIIEMALYKAKYKLGLGKWTDWSTYKSLKEAYGKAKLDYERDQEEEERSRYLEVALEEETNTDQGPEKKKEDFSNTLEGVLKGLTRTAIADLEKAKSASKEVEEAAKTKRTRVFQQKTVRALGVINDAKEELEEENLSESRLYNINEEFKKVDAMVVVMMEEPMERQESMILKNIEVNLKKARKEYFRKLDIG